MASSYSRRLVNAGTVFCQERIVSRRARETQQSRETFYRDARKISEQLEEAARLRELERRALELEAENAQLRTLATANPFHDPDKVAQFAAMAQAEGVSLPVAQRLLTILRAPTRRP